ncbi:MAG: N-6 DNA methylase [Succinivibrio sp.]|nr:N-6 DNA methylase [Succinivibrio sp.]
MKNPEGSASTRHNWDKLKSSKIGRLSARANKTLSSKIIIPEEYSLNITTLAFVHKLLALQSQFAAFDLIKALALDLLRAAQLLQKPHVIAFLNEYDLQAATLVPEFEPPLDEWDLLGLCYQALVTEGLRNQHGIYYTPSSIATDLTSKLDLQEGDFLDPCCGSGSILLAVKTKDPRKLIGFDTDPIAVFIAKCNLLLKYKRKAFTPRIYCLDFLSESIDSLQDLLKTRLCAAATNPPWGAALHPTAEDEQYAKESFALFFVKTAQLLPEGAQLNFLFPQALVNVTAHTNLRRFILEHCSLTSLTTYGKLFSGVTTTYIALCAQKKSSDTPDSTQFVYTSEHSSELIDTRHFDLLPNYSFLPLSDLDATIIQKMQDLGKLSLNNSIFALGIVTGDNQRRLFKTPQEGLEPILSGKEIKPFVADPPQNYIHYERDKLQQVAADTIYRAPAKLIYKFISSNLVFAYDDRQTLVLNSANVLIPQVESLSIFSILGLLNSQVLQFYYLKTCNEVKILKSNLCRLPLPQLTAEQDLRLTTLVKQILEGQDAELNALNQTIFEFYKLTEDEQAYLVSTLKPKK